MGVHGAPLEAVTVETMTSQDQSESRTWPGCSNIISDFKVCSLFGCKKVLKAKNKRRKTNVS